MIHCSTRMFSLVVGADGPNKDIACRRFLTKVQECVGPWMHEVTVVRKCWRCRPFFIFFQIRRFHALSRFDDFGGRTSVEKDEVAGPIVFVF